MVRWPDEYPDPASVRFPEEKWDPNFKKAIPEALKYPDRLTAVDLIDPPDTPTVRGELDAILSHRDASDFADRVPDIRTEDGAPPPSLFRPLRADTDGPNQNTRKLLLAAVTWSVPYIMYFKSVRMRPRPNQLDPTIETVVGVPGHPAYPSGHSTQAHLMALVGYEISRDRKIRATLWAAADRIAENREYAGLHYRSDSLCGTELGRQLLPFFIQDHLPDIVAVRNEEWP